MDRTLYSLDAAVQAMPYEGSATPGLLIHASERWPLSKMEGCEWISKLVPAADVLEPEMVVIDEATKMLSDTEGVLSREVSCAAYSVVLDGEKKSRSLLGLVRPDETLLGLSAMLKESFPGYTPRINRILQRYSAAVTFELGELTELPFHRSAEGTGLQQRIRDLFPRAF